MGEVAAVLDGEEGVDQCVGNLVIGDVFTQLCADVGDLIAFGVVNQR